LKRTIEKPGPYAAYSADLIGVSDIIKTEREEWGIQSLRLKSREEIDPAEYYVIKSNTPIRFNSLALSQNGLILDINSGSLTDRGKLINGNEERFPDLSFNDLGAGQYSSIQRDTAYRVVKVDSVFLRVPYLVEKKKQLTKEQLAELAARTLLELREGRHLILTGEANVFPQSEAAINEINRLEKEYMSLFAGKTWSETINMTIYFVPETGETKGNATLFRLSQERGVTETSGNLGEPVTIALVPTGKTKPLYVSEGVQMASSSAPKGLIYRIPEVAEVTIQYGKSTLLRTRTIVHQFGQKVVIPENILIAR